MFTHSLCIDGNLLESYSTVGLAQTKLHLVLSILRTNLFQHSPTNDTLVRWVSPTCAELRMRDPNSPSPTYRLVHTLDVRDS